MNTRFPTRGAAPAGPRRALALGALLLLGAGASLPGCYAPQLAVLRSGLDSLRAVVDTMTVRDSVTLVVLQSTRREVAEQRDILLSTRASTGSTTQELFDQMTRLEGKLDEVMGRFTQLAQRPAPTTPSAGDMGQTYDQATADLSQGRYALAIQGFRDFLRRYPTAELADNAQYGVGEGFFAQSVFDSAEVEYARVDAQYPTGDKVPASLYKVGLCRDRLGRATEARKAFEDLLKRFPLAGEAALARERLGSKR